MPLDFNLSLDRLVICSREPLETTRKKVANTLEIIRKQGYSRFNHTAFSQYYRFSGSFAVAGHGGKPANVFFQAVPRYGGNQPDYRIDFNPATVLPQGVIGLQDVLDWLGLDPWEFFSQGTVTRVDYALDLYGLTAEDVIARHSRARKHQVCSGAGGKLVKTDDLLSVIDHDEAIPEHLIDSIRLRGFKALDPLSSKHRNKIMRAFKDPAFSLMPEVEGVWGQCSDMLMRSGIGCLLQGKTQPTGLAALIAGAA